MDALMKASTFNPFLFAANSTTLPPIQFQKPISHFPSKPSPPSRTIHSKTAKFKIFTAISPEISAQPESPSEPETEGEKFDWYAEWYPVMPICDLDKRRPHGKRILGIDVVVWWDRNEEEWKVMDDACPHRLAPLSDGRIDQWGRLQCVYHGWCFGGSGDCKFIPQAPRDGPPIHTSKRACVAVYPSCVQNGILWFWPNSDPLYKDIFMKKKPLYIPEIDDPSYTKSMITRDIPYGYEVLIENLMDPAHVHYAHYGIMRIPPTPTSLKADREGGKPLEINITQLDKNGFKAKQLVGRNFFVPPCVYYGYYSFGGSTTSQSNSSPNATEEKSSNTKVKKAFLVFYCIPVSPGNSRLIFAAPRNFAVWVEKVVPRWIFHIGQNLVLDSDLYLLHVEEHKLKEIGPDNWHKSCFVPTKADALVVAYRRWLNKYAGGQVDWRSKFSGVLPQTPPREQLMDRYWSHTVKCSSCSVAYKNLNVLEVVLQVVAIASIGIVAATKQGGLMSVARRNGLIAMAVLCFVASKWLSHFIYKNFRYHDYDHAFR